VNDTQLATACLFLALAGTGVLFLSARGAEPEETEISALGEEDVGRLVEVRGLLASVSEKNGNFFLKMCSGDCVRVVVFKGLAEDMRKNSIDLSLLEKGQAIGVVGVVKEYLGEVEIVPLDRNSIEVAR